MSSRARGHPAALVPEPGRAIDKGASTNPISLLGVGGLGRVLFHSRSFPSGRDLPPPRTRSPGPGRG
eukprot:9209612-Pyramimonas_sp.AAC.1